MSQLYSWKENSTRCFHRITNTVFHSCWLVAKQKKKEKNEIMLGLRFGTKAGKFFECHDSGYMSHRTGDRESKSQNQSFCYEHSALTLMVEMKKQLKPEKFSDFLMSHKWLTGELLNMYTSNSGKACTAHNTSKKCHLLQHLLCAKLYVKLYVSLDSHNNPKWSVLWSMPAHRWANTS